MSIDWADILGYGVGLLSVFATLILHYRNQLTTKDLERAEETSASEAREAQSRLTRLAKSYHDIAFSVLVKHKNIPADMVGMSRQRDAFAAALTSLQTLARSEADKVALEGAYVYGADLGQIENAESTVRSWLISPDFRPDIDDSELLNTVAENIANGSRYVYIVPSDLDGGDIGRFMRAFQSHASIRSLDIDVVDDRLRFLLLDRKQFRPLFGAGNIAIYECGSTGPDPTEILGFDEVVLPDQRRGSLWQRQSKTKAMSTLDTVKPELESAALSSTLSGVTINLRSATVPKGTAP